MPQPEVEPTETEAPSLQLPTVPAEQLAAIEETIDAATEQIVTTVQADSGNLDVSVRVFSPGEDEAVSQEASAYPAVSDPEPADISPDAESTTSIASSGDTTDANAVNTNVSVRVLSPGDDGPVSQVADGGDAQNEQLVPTLRDGEQAGPAPVSVEGDNIAAQSLSDDNSSRYHEEDSQYQSSSDVDVESWHWVWQLSIDCAGNPTSASTETGGKSSLIWEWDWSWNWGCSDPARAPPIPETATAGDDQPSGGQASNSGTTNTNVSVRVLSPGDNGPVTQTTTSSSDNAEAPAESAPTGAPWSWSWTFTFCGQTTSFTMDADSQSPLTWAWDWAWNWTCDAGVGAPPDLDGPTAGTSMAPLPTQSVVIPAAPATLDVEQTLAQWSEPTASTAHAMDVVPSIDVVVPQIDVAVDVAIDIGLPIPIASTDQALQSVNAGAVGLSVHAVPTVTSAAVEPLPVQPPGRQTQPSRGGIAGSITRPALSHHPRSHARSSSGASIEKPANRVSARPAPPDRRDPRPLLGQRGSFQTSGAPGTFGTRIPSTPVVAVAALLAFFMLAAPRVGRRIRVARELSPRSASSSSIDHPG